MSSQKKVTLAKLSLNSGCVSVIWWMLPTQEPLGRSLLLSFATVATESENRLSDSLLILLDFIAFFLYWLQRKEKKKHNAFSSSGALYLIFPVLIFTPSPMICWTFLCDPCIMMVYFPKVKSPVLPRISWKGGCFLWFLSGGSWVRRLLEKERPWGSLKIVSVLQLKKKGS